MKIASFLSKPFWNINKWSVWEEKCCFQTDIQVFKICNLMLHTLESLTGQQHDRSQTESQELQLWTAVSTLLSYLHSVASNEVIGWLTDHPVSADGDDLRWNSNPNFADWPMSHAKCMTKDDRKNPVTQQGRNSCPWLQFLPFSLDSIMSLSH